MTDYCTLAEVKLFIDTGSSDDDALLAQLITRASKRIDAFCGRTFVKRTGETRYFDAIRDVDGRVLYLDDDLLAVTSVTNGDGDAVSSSDYVLLPTNRSPKYAIKLKASASESWTYTDDPEEAITVVGSWGYHDGTVPPDDIKHAAIALTHWYYVRRDAPFDITATPELGQVQISSDWPAEVKATLTDYMRTAVGGGHVG